MSKPSSIFVGKHDDPSTPYREIIRIEHRDDQGRLNDMETFRVVHPPLPGELLHAGFSIMTFDDKLAPFGLSPYSSLLMVHVWDDEAGQAVGRTRTDAAIHAAGLPESEFAPITLLGYLAAPAEALVPSRETMQHISAQLWYLPENTPPGEFYRDTIAGLYPDNEPLPQGLGVHLTLAFPGVPVYLTLEVWDDVEKWRASLRPQLQNLLDNGLVNHLDVNNTVRAYLRGVRIARPHRNVAE